MSDYAIKVEGLGKKYLLRHQATGKRYVALRDVLADKVKSLFQNRRPATGNRKSIEEFWALKDVNFEVKAGEAVGIIGRNGAGKSTLLKVLSRITEPTTGRIRLRGRVASLLEVGTGFHPELTGRENIFLNGAVLGMHRAEIAKKFDEIVAFAEVEKFLDTPVKRYSSGMYMRLAFAVAAHLEPEILIVDEVLAVGDAEFQKKCMGKMDTVAQDGRTVLFVSHNLQAIRQMCKSVILLKQGQVAFKGETHVGINLYLDQNAAAHAGTTDLTTYPRQRPPEVGRLLSLKFLNQHGEQVARLGHTEDLTIEIRFRIDQPVDTLDIPMAILHADGTKIFSEAYSDQFKKLKLGVGEYRVRFSIPMRFLKLESYSLIVCLFDGPRFGDMVEGLPLPELINEEADAHMETCRLGLVRIPVAWQPVDLARTA
jgi:lipopolysaccharide transport system ATP-binding protein